MRTSRHVSMIVILMAGGLSGYAAATVQFRATPNAGAAVVSSENAVSTRASAASPAARAPDCDAKPDSKLALSDAVADANVIALAQAEKAIKAGRKPNILVVWGDDIGYWNVSAYNQGMMPKIFNLRSDPFEKADRIGADYEHWRIDRTFLLVPAQQYIGQFLATFKEFPPSQKVGSFSLDQVLETLQKGGGNK